MENIKVDEALLAFSMLPEGIVERWFIASGATIKVGERIAGASDDCREGEPRHRTWLCGPDIERQTATRQRQNVRDGNAA